MIEILSIKTKNVKETPVRSLYRQHNLYLGQCITSAYYVRNCNFRIVGPSPHKAEVLDDEYTLGRHMRRVGQNVTTVLGLLRTNCLLSLFIIIITFLGTVGISVQKPGSCTNGYKISVAARYGTYKHTHTHRHRYNLLHV